MINAYYCQTTGNVHERPKSEHRLPLPPPLAVRQASPCRLNTFSVYENSNYVLLMALRAESAAAANDEGTYQCC